MIERERDNELGREGGETDVDGQEKQKDKVPDNKQNSLINSFTLLNRFCNNQIAVGYFCYNRDNTEKFMRTEMQSTVIQTFNYT